MVITQCKQCMKYFDSDAYQNCPMCGAKSEVLVNNAQGNVQNNMPNHAQNTNNPVQNAPNAQVYQNFAPPVSQQNVPAVPPVAAPAKKGLFGKKKKKEAESVQSPVIMPTGYRPAPTPEPAPAPQPVQSPISYTPPIPTNTASAPEEIEKSAPVGCLDDSVTQALPVGIGSMDKTEADYPNPSVAENTTAPISDIEVSANRVEDADERTFGYFNLGSSLPSAANNEETQPENTESAEKAEDIKKSSAPIQNAFSAASPVVGWLVCVKGAHFGESFSIGAGRNSVGRYDSNSIVLSKERTVSREKHAWIVFEPRKKEFFVAPGESSGLTYYNGENIFQPQKLGALDSIELGEAGFVFVPLCSDSFDWENYINKNN